MDDQPKLTGFGKLVALVVIGGCLAGAAVLFLRGPWSASKSNASANGDAATGSSSGSATGRVQERAPTTGDLVEIGIAYGSEKHTWFTWAVPEFAKTEAGRKIKINLKKMGSIEGAQAVLKEDKSINVWSPASRLYEHTLVDEWKLRRGGDSPIIKGELLALTPMVYVMWEERFKEFDKKFAPEGGLNFRTIEKAFQAKGGWNDIAGKPEWGFFKFGHTHPQQSNSGLMTLILMAYDYHNKTTNLTMSDITDPKFQTWATSLQRGVTGLSTSTDNMMVEMVQRGPSTYDALFVYENTAIDRLESARDRSGRVRVVYPEKNAWNDNPYYVLNVPWSDKKQQAAAQAFLDFLMSEPAQQRALVHGFRPGNVNVSISGPDSPFTKYQEYGVRLQLPTVCDLPSGEVIQNLLIRWQQTRGG